MLDPSGKEVSFYSALERVYRDPSNESRGADLKIKEGYRKLDGSEITQDDISDITNKVATIN